MKTLMKFLLFAVIALLAMLPGCGKDDDKVLNNMTINGNESTLYEINMDYTSLEGLFKTVDWKCTNPTSGHIIHINLTPSAVIVIYLFTGEYRSTVIPGTFKIGSFCDLGGAEAWFEFSTENMKIDLWMSSGTVTITKDESIYDIDVDLTIDPDAGGGKLKGNYHGEVTSTSFK